MDTSTANHQPAVPDYFRADEVPAAGSTGNCPGCTPSHARALQNDYCPACARRYYPRHLAATLRTMRWYMERGMGESAGRQARIATRYGRRIAALSEVST